MALRSIVAVRLLRQIASPAVAGVQRKPLQHALRHVNSAHRCWASTAPQKNDGSTPETAAPLQADKMTSKAEEAEEETYDSPPTNALGGFMRGLIGGQAVAAEDAYVAEAKKQGIEVPPTPPRRSELVALKRRKRVEDETEKEETIRDRLFSRFSGSAFMQGAFEAKERISERIDESDNPVVNFFRNIYDSIFAENEMAMVIREIREEDKQFTVSEFLREVEEVQIPDILRAYLSGDRKKLKRMCTEGAYEMLNASIREREAAKVTIDTNILAINDVELSAGKLLEDAPVLIVSFSAQQINCLRDPAGEIVEGAEDDIRAVYYVFAFVREVEFEHDVPTGGGMGSSTSEAEAWSEESSRPDDAGDENEEGEEEKGAEGPPPWKMMEMVIRGAHSTI